MKDFEIVISILERINQINLMLDQLTSDIGDNADNPQYLALMGEHIRLTAEVGKRFGIFV